jgi:hypothetical protein
MKLRIIIFALILLCSKSWGQVSKPIKINWVDSLSGDFSFTNNWSYPLGVEMKTDGKAGCADGGFCPERCYSMLDSNGIALKDSAQIFYQLLDRKNKDSIFCYTLTGIATHCSLQLGIIKNICTATIDLNSITPDGSATFYCIDGHITIDKKLWKKGIMKAEFNFIFENKDDKKKPFYWKGEIYAKIKTT